MTLDEAMELFQQKCREKRDSNFYFGMRPQQVKEDIYWDAFVYAEMATPE